MATRKAAFEDDENPLKRQRVDEERGISDDDACFDALNEDCALHILSHLPFGDLNTFALVSRRYRLLRNHESLDQKREAVIVCSSEATVASFRAVMDAASRALNANYTKLNILGMEVLENAEEEPWNEVQPLPALVNVTTLSLVATPNEQGEHASIAHQSLIADYLPNMNELLLHNLSCCDGRTRLTGQATKLIMTGCILAFEGGGLTMRRLVDLTLIECRFAFNVMDFVPDIPDDGFARAAIVEAYSEGNEFCILLNSCRNLERLNVQNATWSVSKSEDSHTQPVTQEMLMKMVRHFRALRWFRSNLSLENVETLQQERPEITFVTTE